MALDGCANDAANSIPAAAIIWAGLQPRRQDMRVAI
jgi:hypothetical protein